MAREFRNQKRIDQGKRKAEIKKKFGNEELTEGHIKSKINSANDLQDLKKALIDVLAGETGKRGVIQAISLLERD